MAKYYGVIRTGEYLMHHGIKGQKWGIKNGPPYPLDANKTVKAKAKTKARALYNEMTNFDYGGIVNGKKITEPEYYDINFGKDYRTIPVEVMKKEKIGNCWDMVNYQHAYFKKNGIKDHSFMVVMNLDDNENSDNVLTHTFSVFESGKNLYWFEQAWWPERGIKKIDSYRDVLNKFIEKNGDHNYFVSEYNPDGMDKGLTDKEFFNRATKNIIEDHEKGTKYELKHYGVKGQKWGVRRYQNKDGTRTPLGNKVRAEKRRAGYRPSDTVFISGSSKTQTKESPYYRKQLPKSIKQHLDEIMKHRAHVVVGDAPGIDRQVQNYLDKYDYDRVEVYGPGEEVRYTANKQWKTHAIDAPQYEEGSSEWLAEKDKVMSKVANKGIAVVLDHGAKATRKNVTRMRRKKKPVTVFELNQTGANKDHWL